VLAFEQAFASVAVLASVADTVMPDAYRQEGGPWSPSLRLLAFCLPF
jgi:hypothetical protein